VKKQKLNPFVLAAVACAVVAVLLFLQYQKELEAKHKADLERVVRETAEKLGSGKSVVTIEKTPTRPVVFTKVPIRPRTQMARELLQTKDVPLDLIPEDAVTDVADAESKFSARELDSNELLTRSKLKSKDQLGGLSYRLEPGKRAVSLTVQDPARAAGFFINDGDFVDLLQNDKEGTRTVLQNIKVLSIATGDVSDESQTLPRRTAGGTATFEVTPEQAQLLVQIESQGPIRLILRGVSDKEVSNVKPLLMEDITGNPQVLQKISDRSVKTYEQKKSLQQEKKNATPAP
jgi:pilus assembly protein CpaB